MELSQYIEENTDWKWGYSMFDENQKEVGAVFIDPSYDFCAYVETSGSGVDVEYLLWITLIDRRQRCIRPDHRVNKLDFVCGILNDIDRLG